MMGGIFLRINSIFNTFVEGSKLLLNRRKSEIISNASKCNIIDSNKKNNNRYNGEQVNNLKANTSAKYKIKEMRR